jgi:hypothetical protein
MHRSESLVGANLFEFPPHSPCRRFPAIRDAGGGSNRITDGCPLAYAPGGRGEPQEKAHRTPAVFSLVEAIPRLRFSGHYLGRATARGASGWLQCESKAPAEQTNCAGQFALFYVVIFLNVCKGNQTFRIFTAWREKGKSKIPLFVETCTKTIKLVFFCSCLQIREMLEILLFRCELYITVTKHTLVCIYSSWKYS